MGEVKHPLSLLPQNQPPLGWTEIILKEKNSLANLSQIPHELLSHGIFVLWPFYFLVSKNTCQCSKCSMILIVFINN